MRDLPYRYFCAAVLRAGSKSARCIFVILRHWGCACKGFYLQVLLECFEEQLNVPSAFIELAGGVGTPFKIIGDEFDSSVVFGIIHHHSPHGIMITIFLMK